MDFKVLFTDNRLKVAFTLFLVWLLAVWHFHSIEVFLRPFLAVFATTVLDLAITWVRSKKFYFPAASLVTGYLIGLIIDPAEPLWILAAAVIIAVVSKQFIGKGIRQHIFNPAAFGIMAVALMFGIPVSWWGIAWSKLPLLILAPLMIRILWGMKRLWLPVGFLTVYFLYTLTFAPSTTAFEVISDSSVLLFTLVMLPEPMTSLAKGWLKYGFGPMVAIVAIILSKLATLPDAFLPALLISNLGGFLLATSKINLLKNDSQKAN